MRVCVCVCVCACVCSPSRVLEEMDVRHDEGFSGRMMEAIDTDGDGVLGKCCRSRGEDEGAEELVTGGAGGVAGGAGGGAGEEGVESGGGEEVEVVLEKVNLNHRRRTEREKRNVLLLCRPRWPARSCRMAEICQKSAASPVKRPYIPLKRD